MANILWKRQTYTGGGATALDGIDGNDLTVDDWALVLTSSDLMDVYELDNSGDTEDGSAVIAPDTNPGSLRWKRKRLATDNSIPVGSIVPWQGGYWNSGASSYTDVLGNTVSAINTLLNPDGWYVCDNSELNLAGSSIYNGAGRYLPLLTDDRFIMGDSVCGVTGGANTHSHTGGNHTLASSEIPAHTHQVNSYPSTGTGADVNFASSGSSGYNLTTLSNTGGGGSHNHGSTSADDGRPKFVGCVYIQRCI